MRDELQQLVTYLEDDIKVYEHSRRIHMAPAERAGRIKQRKDWIAALQRLDALADAAEDTAMHGRTAPRVDCADKSR